MQRRRFETCAGFPVGLQLISGRTLTLVAARSISALELTAVLARTLIDIFASTQPQIIDYRMVIWLNAIALHRKPISELRSVTRRMGSHSVTCHPTQVNTPRLNHSQISRYTRFTYPGGIEG